MLKTLLNISFLHLSLSLLLVIVANTLVAAGIAGYVGEFSFAKLWQGLIKNLSIALAIFVAYWAAYFNTNPITDGFNLLEAMTLVMEAAFSYHGLKLIDKLLKYFGVKININLEFGEVYKPAEKPTDGFDNAEAKIELLSDGEVKEDEVTEAGDDEGKA